MSRSGARDGPETQTLAGGVEPLPVAPPVLPRRFRVGRLLGKGGQAQVWLADDLELGEQVAVKVFGAEASPTARERLRREVRLGRSLQHPGLVRMFELIDAGERPAVVMEWMPGGSVAERLRRGPLAIEEVHAIARDVLEALAYLHAEHVLHRDIKPSNLLFDSSGRARLGDLGLARSLAEESELTRTRTAVGTPAFMSPEQLRGIDAVPGSDLYALGVTLFQLITGKLPFDAPSEFELARLHQDAPIPDPRTLRGDCPPWLARLVVRLLQKSPRDRYGDGEDALAALTGQRITASPRTVRRRVMLGAAVAALLAAALLAVRLAGTGWRRDATVHVAAAGTVIRGSDSRGRPTWEVPVESTVQNTIRVDLDGDGDDETVVSASDTLHDRTTAPMKSEVVVVNRRGEVVSRRHPEDVLPTWPFEFPKALVPFPQLLDLDGDNLPEVVLRCNQRGFYPAAIVVYWPQRQLWEPLKFHTGHLTDVATVPGSSPTRLQFLAVNNLLGGLPVVGEFVVWPPGVGNDLEEPAPSWLADAAPQRSELSWYTVLGEGDAAHRLDVTASGSIGMTGSDVVFRLDRWGNLQSGPNAETDLTAERIAFLRFVGSFDEYHAPVDRASVSNRIEQARRDLAPLLAEPPYAALLALVGARGLAAVGDLDGAVEILERARAAVPFEELAYRLAHVRAVSGRLAEAADLLTQLSVAPKTPRFQFDGVHLLLRIAIERHDTDGFRRVLPRLMNAGIGANKDSAGVQAALWARAHLWWDEVTEADTTVHAWLYSPDGDAVAGLARWRLGRTRSDDIATLQAAIEESPDAAWEGRLALAAAQSAVGKHREALSGLAALIAGLEPRSRDDFMNRQLLDLARAVNCRALFDAGEKAAARREAAALRPSLRAGLLPAALIDELRLVPAG